MKTDSRSVPWRRLQEEFSDYSPGDDELTFREDDFVAALTAPVPPFVGFLLQRKLESGSPYGAAVRDLYFFLLGKRYEERLNLLHFAFEIFDESSQLPREVVERTPFPHEDGLPRYGDPRVCACRPGTTTEA
jgi:hypothetical protein